LLYYLLITMSAKRPMVVIVLLHLRHALFNRSNQQDKNFHETASSSSL